jgi:hypothetical protein
VVLGFQSRGCPAVAQHACWLAVLLLQALLGNSFVMSRLRIIHMVLVCSVGWAWLCCAQHISSLFGCMLSVLRGLDADDSRIAPRQYEQACVEAYKHLSKQERHA